MKTQKPNKYTTNQFVVAGITIYDSNSKFRRDFLKHHLKNTVDVVRFSFAMGKLAAKPVIGPVIAKALALHYRYIHTNSVIVPNAVAQELIKNTTDMAVSPCVCRSVQQKCDNPLNTCFGINFYGELKKKAGERGVTKEEALAVAEKAKELHLIAAIETCVQPYQDNLCFCCPCCCMPLNLKTTYHVPFVNYYGPYLPHFNDSKCAKCSKCVEVCPVHAITVDEAGHHLDLNKCLGCGNCELVCPDKNISMHWHEERNIPTYEPTTLRVFLSVLYVYAILMPGVWVYKLFAGSKQNLMKLPPRDSDVLK